jgi:hypothetical protein
MASIASIPKWMPRTAIAVNAIVFPHFGLIVYTHEAFAQEHRAPIMSLLPSMR